MISFATAFRSRPALAQMAQSAPGWLRRWRAALTTTGRAHAQRCLVESLPADMCRDSGLCPEDAAGGPLWQEDLPFFMQSGFGRGRQDRP